MLGTSSPSLASECGDTTTGQPRLALPAGKQPAFEPARAPPKPATRRWGEIEDAHLVTDDETGQSKGFAFLKYEDFRSAVLAVDNMNGARLLNRMLRVDHKLDYTPPKPKDAGGDGEAAAGSDEGYTPGAAYKDQELANGFSLQQGVDVFGRAAAASGSEGVAVPLSSLVGAHGRLATAGPRSGVDWRARSAASEAPQPAASAPLYPPPPPRPIDDRNSHRRKRARSEEASEGGERSHRRRHHHRSSRAGAHDEGRSSSRGGEGRDGADADGRHHRHRRHHSSSSRREEQVAGAASEAASSHHSRRRHRHDRAGRVKHRGAMPEDLAGAAEAAARASAAACSFATPGLDRAD